jgi:hypothetical protein
MSTIAWDVTAHTRFDLIPSLWDPVCEWHWDETPVLHFARTSSAMIPHSDSLNSSVAIAIGE